MEAGSRTLAESRSSRRGGQSQSPVWPNRGQSDDVAATQTQLAWPRDHVGARAGRPVGRRDPACAPCGSWSIRIIGDDCCRRVAGYSGHRGGHSLRIGRCGSRPLLGNCLRDPDRCGQCRRLGLVLHPANTLLHDSGRRRFGGSHRLPGDRCAAGRTVGADPPSGRCLGDGAKRPRGRADRTPAGSDPGGARAVTGGGVRHGG
jgi:hypothetical protein